MIHGGFKEFQRKERLIIIIIFKLLFIYLFLLKKAKILCCLEKVKAKRVPLEIIFKV